MRNRASLSAPCMLLLAAVAIFPAAVSVPSQCQAQEQVLFSFQEDDNGAYPESAVTVDSNGIVYGTASLAGANGAGTVYKITPDGFGGWTYALIHTFNGTSDGLDPRKGLLLAPTGKLYGVTDLGGTSVFGTAFEMTPNGDAWDFKVIHNFGKGVDASGPSGTLISDAKGNLYGSTYGGGGSANCNLGCGAVYELKRSPSGKWSEKVLYGFQGGPDGTGPIGSLAIDPAGNLYGLTSGGGSNQCSGGCGTAFKLTRTPSGPWQKKILGAFADKAHGWLPYDGVTLDQAGNLYGTTSLGGDVTCNPPNGCGTAFKLNRSGQETVLHRFGQTKGDGTFPMAGLIQGDPGHFYGTTYEGGTNANGCGAGCGIVFEMNATGKLRILYSFSGPDGAMPAAPLFRDAAGHLFGTTFEGGDSFTGATFEIAP